MVKLRRHIGSEISAQRADLIVQKFWDKDVRAWNSYWAPIFRRFARDLVSEGHITQGKIVLDIGTGTGVAAMEAAKLVRPGGLVLAIDRSKPMIRFAESNVNPRFKNVVFLTMDGGQMKFPSELFDIVLSNCGISYTMFPTVLSEAFRVLRKGGLLVLNDWHLREVQAHRIFGDILQRYRTENPSEELRSERVALATFEHAGSRYVNLNELLDEVLGAGFKGIGTKYRTYRIRLRGVTEFLDMRLQRAALKRELQELPPAKRRIMINELRNGLKSFIHNGRFSFDWKIVYIRAQKPN